MTDATGTDCAAGTTQWRSKGTGLVSVAMDLVAARSPMAELVLEALCSSPPISTSLLRSSPGTRQCSIWARGSSGDVGFGVLVDAAPPLSLAQEANQSPILQTQAIEESQLALPLTIIGKSPSYVGRMLIP
ncbi:hypothetical protein SEVIR_1G030050v4 [Setaria viridis]